jgi:hypothetical protein
VSLRGLGSGRACEVQFGRFLSNKKVKVIELIDNVCKSTIEASKDRHVLLIEDTTEANFQDHVNRVKGLGTVGNGKDVGFFVHPLLAVDAQEGVCLGLADLHIWQRTEPQSKDYKKLPIEEKESFRWIETAERGKSRLSQTPLLTVVADREADIYELWDRLPDERTHVLVRASQDRLLVHSEEDKEEKERKLFGYMDCLPVEGSYILDLPATKKRSKHDAVMVVRFGQVRIKRPQSRMDKSSSSDILVSIIDVREDDSSVVGNEVPIHWRLVTTHEVKSMAQARQCIEWYCQRWHIEQTFRTVKSQGLDIESSLIESGEKLEKLAVLAFSAAVKVMQLVMARDGSTRPATDVFDEDDIEVLQHVGKSLEGKTEKQKNHYEVGSLAWSAWIIARLGGWKGYKSERKPGPITMLNGLKDFANIQRGWMMAKMVLRA